jgi:thioesterase domain-containing protein
MSMTVPAELEQYLHQEIPLSRAMAVAVLSVTADSVLLQAPLNPNINHHDTVFGGSASALAILAGWSLLYVRLGHEAISGRVVIQRHTMEYERPMAGTFTARAALEEPQRWGAFRLMLERHGKARISVTSVLEQAGNIAAWFRGEFVALGAERSVSH